MILVIALEVMCKRGQVIQIPTIVPVHNLKNTETPEATFG
jgi:hypothetical protein